MPQAVKDLAVQLQLDLAPYRKGLEAMVGATREAADVPRLVCWQGPPDFESGQAT